MLLRVRIDWHFFLNFRSILSDKDYGMMRIKNILRIQGLFATLGILAIVGIGSATFAPFSAFAEDRSTRQSVESCLAEFTDKPLKEIRLEQVRKNKNFPVLLSANQTKILYPDQLDSNIRDYCPRNDNFLTESTGAKHNRLGTFNKKFSVKLPGLSEQKVKKDGVCEATYEAIFLAYSELRKFGKSICEDRAEIEVENRNCITADNSESECVGKLEKSIEKLETINRDATTAKKDVGKFLEEIEKPIRQALKKHEEDRVHFFQQLQATPRPTAPTFADSTPFVPGDFGALNLDQYLQWIGKDQSTQQLTLNDNKLVQYRQVEGADLVNEQILALSFLIAYNAKIAKGFFDELDAKSAADVRSFREHIGKIKARLPGDNDWKKWADKSPAAVAAAAPLLQGAKGAASGIAGAGTIAALGAGAAIGSQVASGRSSAALGDSLPTQQTPNPIAPLAKTTLNDGNGPAEKNSDVGNQIPGQKNATSDKPEVKESSGNPVGSNPAVFSSGASFKQNGFKPRATKASTAASGDLGSPGKSDDALKPFGGELLAGPAPKKVDSSGDVSSLLGQMKDLFNFDDAGGMPGGSEGMPNFDQPGPFSGTEGAFPGEGPADEFTGVGGSEEEIGRQFASHEDEIIGSPTQARSYLGGIETPLFKRVKSRHKRCMEKGLVILGLGKIPQ